MNSADMVHLVPNPDDLLNVSMPEQGRLILRLLTLADNPTNELTGPTKSGRFSYHNFFNRANDFAAPPKYGGEQRAVDEALMGAWAWLAGQGHLAKDPGAGSDWYFVTKAGRAFITAARVLPVSGSSETHLPPSARESSERNDPGQETPRPTVFISYTWENDNHQAWVLAFAKRLRDDDGINARLDQLHLRLGDRSPQFMEGSVRDSDYVLVICTESYKRKFDARQGGAGYEGHIITAEMVSEKGRGKFIPILRQGSWDTSIPTALTGIFGVDLRHDSLKEYRKLVTHLKSPDGTSPTENHSSAGGPPDSPSVITQSGEVFSEPLFLPKEDMPLVTETRSLRLVVWIRNDTLDPMPACGLTVAAIQAYSQRYREFHRNPFKPVSLITPENIMAGGTSSEAPAIASTSPPPMRELRILDVISKQPGTWLVSLLVEGNGMRRREDLFIQWTPGSIPAFVADPRTITPPAPAPVQTEDGRYRRERRDLPETELVKSIWQRPHWRILIQPHQYLPGHFRTPNECEAFVKRGFVVALGNESLPIVTAGTSFHTGTSPAYVRGETDYADLPALCETWALFQSAQFVLSRPLPTNRPSPKEIHYLEILHVVTQAFEFGRRLAVECDIQGLVTYNVSLRNVLGHKILVPKRFPSSHCKTDNIDESEAFSPLDGPDVVFERAIALVLRIYAHFGWLDASANDLRRQQERQRL